MKKEFDLTAKQNYEILEALKVFNSEYGYLDVSAVFVIGSEVIHVKYDADRDAFWGHAPVPAMSKLSFTSPKILDHSEFMGWKFRAGYSDSETMTLDGYSYTEILESFREYSEGIRENLKQLENAWKSIFGGSDE